MVRFSSLVNLSVTGARDLNRRASHSDLFKPRASCLTFCSLHTFQFISCNFILKLKSFPSCCKCELHFLKVTLTIRNKFSSWHSRFALEVRNRKQRTKTRDWNKKKISISLYWFTCNIYIFFLCMHSNDNFFAWNAGRKAPFWGTHEKCGSF